MADNQTDNIQLDPNTGQYYTEQTSMPQNYGGLNGLGRYGYYGMGIAGGRMMSNNYGMPTSDLPITTRTNTGDISQVWKQMQNRQPYQYNVPSIAQMFPSMAMPKQMFPSMAMPKQMFPSMALPMPNMDFSQYQGGAGQFLGGLLGNALARAKT